MLKKLLPQLFDEKGVNNLVLSFIVALILAAASYFFLNKSFQSKKFIDHQIVSSNESDALRNEIQNKAIEIKKIFAVKSFRNSNAYKNLSCEETINDDLSNVKISPSVIGENTKVIFKCFKDQTYNFTKGHILKGHYLKNNKVQFSKAMYISNDNSIGHIVALVGDEVFLNNPGSPIKKISPLFLGQTIITGATSFVKILMNVKLH